MYSAIAKNRTKSVFLIVAFLALVIAVGYAYGLYAGDPYGATIVASVVSVTTGFVGYYTSDKVALAASGAKPVAREQLPELYRIVENLCLASGTPMPRLYVIDDASLNAFATGRNPQHAAIAVTTGLLEKLERRELEGVLAHELSHIRNYDILVMTLAVVFGGIIAMLADTFFRFGGFTNRGRSDNRNGGGVLVLVGLVLLILAPLAATLIRLAVSRQREYLADASGALLTRYPEGLALALRKISGDPVIERAGDATAHLFIANPLRAGVVNRLFATHPPIEERIKRLERMAGEA